MDMKLSPNYKNPSGVPNKLASEHIYRSIPCKIKTTTTTKTSPGSVIKAVVHL